MSSGGHSVSFGRLTVDVARHSSGSSCSANPQRFEESADQVLGLGRPTWGRPSHRTQTQSTRDGGAESCPGGRGASDVKVVVA